MTSDAVRPEDETIHPTNSPDPQSLKLGFARGVSPSKWERRWNAAAPHIPLELVPLAIGFGASRDPDSCDVVIERTAPDARPAQSEGSAPTRHALKLYTEATALVVSVDHELASDETIAIADLEMVHLLDHPDHAAQWPEPAPWEDPSWMPKHVRAALELVATGLGAILLPLPLARHMTSKREHKILRVTGEPGLAGSTVWATWSVERDDVDVQQLIGVLRGRTARSSRAAAAPNDGGDARTASKAASHPARSGQKPAKKAKLKPNSRGAQLAAAREKVERKKAEKRQAARRKRR